MRKLIGGAMTLALAFTGAACGGDDDDGGDALSKEDFIEQADALCKQFSDESDEAFENADIDFEDMDAVVEFFQDELIDPFDEQLEQLRALNPPEEDAEQINGFWDEGESLLDELSQQLEDDPEAVLASDEDPFADLNAEMQAYGFEECGSGE